MTNITEIMDKAAKEYGDTGSFQEWLKLPQNKSMGFIEGDYAKTIRCFKAGARWATTDPSVLTELLGKFAEWVRMRDGEQKMSLCDHDWYFHSDSQGDYPLSDAELVNQYIQETIKPKEDERNGNS